MNSYNHSALAAAYRCNTLFKLQYVDRLKPDSKPDIDLLFGSSIHFALEEYLTAGLDPLEAFKTYWEPEKTKVSGGRYSIQDLEYMANILLNRFVRLHAKKIKVHQSETRLYGSVGSQKVEGTPDLLGDYNGIPSVIDFKTSGYRYAKERIQTDSQMMMYTHLARQAGYDVKQLVYIVLIKGRTPSIQTLTREVDEKELKKVLANIELQCHSLNRMQQENTYSYNSANCIQGERKCPYFSKCWRSDE